MTLEELVLSIFNKDKIFERTKEIPKFYYSPTPFFKRFFRKNAKERASTALYYVALGTVLLYILSGETFREATKIVLLEIALTLITFLLFSFTRLFIKRFLKEKLQAENLFYLLLLTKFFTAPFQIAFIYFFIHTEVYVFYFLHNVIILQ